MFNSDSGRRARAKVSGRKRAAFWRTTGFANLVLAREQLRLNREARREQRKLEERGQSVFKDDAD